MGVKDSAGIIFGRGSRKVPGRIANHNAKGCKFPVLSFLTVGMAGVLAVYRVAEGLLT